MYKNKVAVRKLRSNSSIPSVHVITLDSDAPTRFPASSSQASQLHPHANHIHCYTTTYNTARMDTDMTDVAYDIDIDVGSVPIAAPQPEILFEVTRA